MGHRLNLGIVAAAFCGLAVWLAGARSGPAADIKPSPQPQPIDFQMRNVNFRIASDITLEIRNLRGQLKRTKPEVPVTFDDGASFLVDVDTAEIAITAQALTALMNSYVLAQENSPIKDVTVEFKGDRLIQKGKVRKGIEVPFEIEGSLSATPSGEIRMHAEKIKAAKIPVKGLLDLIGKDLSSLVKSDAAKGMRVEGDDIILSPRGLTPPPHLQGKITRVGIVGGKLVQHFDAGRRMPAMKPPHRSTAYIYHRNGILRFGKLTMHDADLQIVGDKPGFFEFFQREYLKQLVAGYSKNTASGGLVSHMADYSRFRKQ
jgi:hypothetical protein